MESNRSGWCRAAFLVVALAAAACHHGPIERDFTKLHSGQTPADVTALYGAPTIQESFEKDGVRIEYWSYLVAHYAFRHWSTYECLTFKNGVLTEWISDNGTGGHSAHLAQAGAKKQE